MHQPIETPPSEDSSDMTTGGTLTSELGLPHFAQSDMQYIAPDQTISMPYYRGMFNVSSSDTTGSVTYQTDPWQQLVDYMTFIPNPVTAVRACNFYDFDVELTFLCIKHEKARGRYAIVWVPGSHDLDDNSNQWRNSKNQKWIWDIEQSDQYKVCLKAPKITAWRTRKLVDLRVDPADGTVIGTANFDDEHKPYIGGVLTISPVFSYNAGNVGADTATVLIHQRLKNLTTAEYRQPWSLDPAYELKTTPII